MKLLSFSLLFFISFFAIANSQADNDAMDKMTELMTTIAKMPQEQQKSAATKQKIKHVFIETCLSGAKKSAAKDMASGEVKKEDLKWMMKLVKEKCSCVINNSEVMDTFFNMANKTEPSSPDSKDFQNKISKAMNDCLSQK